MKKCKALSNGIGSERVRNQNAMDGWVKFHRIWSQMHSCKAWIGHYWSCNAGVLHQGDWRVDDRLSHLRLLRFTRVRAGQCRSTYRSSYSYADCPPGVAPSSPGTFRPYQLACTYHLSVLWQAKLAFVQFFEIPAVIVPNIQNDYFLDIRNTV